MASEEEVSAYLNAVSNEELTNLEGPQGIYDKTSYSHVTETQDHIIMRSLDNLSPPLDISKWRKTDGRCLRTARAVTVVGVMIILTGLTTVVTLTFLYTVDLKMSLANLDNLDPHKSSNFANKVIYKTTYINQTKPGCTCPTGWLWCWGGRTCYQIISTFGRTFSEAHNLCSARGAIIASPRTILHNNFLKSVLQSRDNVPNVWLGLVLNVTSRKWVWYNDQTEPTYTSWADREPKGANGERTLHCSVFDKHNYYQWADVGCSRSLSTLCEKQCTNV